MTDTPAIADPLQALHRAQQGKSYWRRVWERLRQDKVTLAMAAVLIALLVMVIFAPWFTVHDPYQGSVLRRLKPVGFPGHWLGTDEVGRDLWSRMVYGGRLSLLAGVMPVFLALLVGGFLGILAGYAGGFPTTWEQLQHFILPVVTLSLIQMGVVSRLVRANVLEILSHEFVSTLHAKGLMSRRVLYHVMKNAAPSALALMGLQFGYLLGGSILVETVFNWPGSGGLMNLAIFRRDIPVLSATILVLAAIFVVINILVDVLQALIDPRMRR